MKKFSRLAAGILLVDIWALAKKQWKNGAPVLDDGTKTQRPKQ